MSFGIDHLIGARLPHGREVEGPGPVSGRRIDRSVVPRHSTAGQRHLSGVDPHEFQLRSRPAARAGIESGDRLPHDRELFPIGEIAELVGDDRATQTRVRRRRLLPLSWRLHGLTVPALTRAEVSSRAKDTRPPPSLPVRLGVSGSSLPHPAASSNSSMRELPNYHDGIAASGQAQMLRRNSSLCEKTTPDRGRRANPPHCPGISQHRHR